jgi:hypothetical protein
MRVVGIVLQVGGVVGLLVGGILFLAAPGRWHGVEIQLAGFGFVAVCFGNALGAFSRRARGDAGIP